MRKARRTAKQTPPNRVKHHRLRLMLSRPELAAKAGISVEALGKIENGKTNPRISTQRKLVVALGYDVKQAEEVFPRYEE